MSSENLYKDCFLAGHAARVYELADSTNTRLKAWAEEGAPDGAVAFAREQSAGRGRFDRKWLSKPGTGAPLPRRIWYLWPRWRPRRR